MFVNLDCYTIFRYDGSFRTSPKSILFRQTKKKKDLKKKNLGLKIENNMATKKNPWVKHVKTVAKAKKITFSKALKVASPSYWKEIAKTTKKKK